MSIYDVRTLENQLNDKDRQKRLAALKELGRHMQLFEKSSDVNNHIHTAYSFSPYSPSKAVYMACISGLGTAGIMDHDSIAGAEEFIEAGRIIGIGTTIGVECRVRMSGTGLEDRKINNPDQKGIAYCAMHGIPHTQTGYVRDYFKPFIENRMARNRKMTGNVNEYLKACDVSLDFEKDVIPLSLYHDGGTITERHILYSLAGKLIERFSKSERLTDFLENILGMTLNHKLKGYLKDKNNEYCQYDLLGALKTDLIDKIYMDADEECPEITDFIDLAKRTGSVSAYAYLGNVGESVTGDKKAQVFEDGYIDELFDLLEKLGFNAVTYMPSRNTGEQLKKVRKLCEEHRFFQISGEDINSPRQRFVCEAMRKPEFQNLARSTYALIGHEKEATKNIGRGMFSESVIKRFPDLESRIDFFGLKAF